MPTFEQTPQHSTDPIDIRRSEALPDLSTIQERHPDWPKLHLSFYFSAHGSDKDMEGIAPHLAKADILLYEDARSDEGVRQSLNRIATNPHRSRRYIVRKLAGDSILPLYLGLYDTGKAAGTMDTGKTAEEIANDHKLTRAFARATELTGHPSPDATYDDALAVYRENLEGITEMQHAREAKMLEHFETEIERILAERPDLKDRQELTVLASLGANHTGVQRLFAEAGMDSQRSFPQKPFVFSYRSELKRDLLFGVDPSDELVQRAFTEQVVSETMYKANHTTDDDIPHAEMTGYMRDIAGAFTPGQMRGLYGAMKNGGIPLSYIDMVLEESGKHRLPRSRDELLGILGHLVDEKKRRKFGGFLVKRQRG